MASNFINPGYGKKKSNSSLLFIIIAIIAVIGIFICVLVINGSKPQCDAPEIKKEIIMELGSEDYKNWNYYFSQIDEKCWNEENIKTDISKVDPTTEGKYDVEVTIGSSQKKVVTLEIQDNILPVLTLKSELVLTADVTQENNGISYKPEDFVEKCEDASGVCEVSYAITNPDEMDKFSKFFEPGTYEISLVANDKPTQKLPQGHQTLPQKTKLIIQEDKKTCAQTNFVAKENINIELGQDIPTEIKDYVTEKNDACWPDDKITINVDNVKNDTAGEYEVIITAPGLEDVKVKVNVIDNHSPKLTTKSVKLTTKNDKEDNGISYTANDFVDKCEVKEGLKCIVQFVTTDIDADGNVVDYSHYTKPGEYTVKLVASVLDDGETYNSIASAKLTIYDEDDAGQNCQFGTKKYDRKTYHLAYDVTENGCAIDPQAYTNIAIRNQVDNIANAEAQRIKLQIEKTIKSNGKTLYLNICKNPVINETEDGLVGYSIRLVVSRDKVDGINEDTTNKNIPPQQDQQKTPENQEEIEEEITGETINDEPAAKPATTNVCDAEVASGKEIIIDYYLNSDYTRSYKTNPYEIPDEVKDKLENGNSNTPSDTPDDGDSV